MQTAATTSHAAFTASPRLSAIIPNETAPSTATAVHNRFVRHVDLLKVGPIDFLLHFSRVSIGSLLKILTTSRPDRKPGATPVPLEVTSSSPPIPGSACTR